MVFLSFLCHPVLGLYIGFWEDDNTFTYNFKSRGKNYKEEYGEKISKQLSTINSDRKDISFSVKKTKYKDKTAYKLRIIAIPDNENLTIDVPKDRAVVLKAVDELQCNNISIGLTTKKQSEGKLINYAILSVDGSLRLDEEITLKNKGTITFNNPVLLKLQSSFLNNGENGNIHFLGEARIIDHNPLAGGDLLFDAKQSVKDKVSLVNKGLISGKDIIGLFTELFISEKGRIKSEKNIIMKWDQRSCKSIGKLKDLSYNLPLLKENQDYPIMDIIRIPKALQKDFSGKDLGEKCAIYFYEEFLSWSSFSDKANNQENGIDVIAYPESDTEKIVVHESKNHENGSFTLDPNQMTKAWVYSYLFKMYQNYLKNYCISIVAPNFPSTSQSFEQIRGLLFNVLHENEIKILKKLEKNPKDYLKKHNDQLQPAKAGGLIKRFQSRLKG